MSLAVTRSNIRLNPDYKKVIPRFFNTGDVRSQSLIQKILQMKDDEAFTLLHHVLDEFSLRYRNIDSIFLKHFELIKHLLSGEEQLALAENKKLLIGSYFTMEYSIEAAAL